jgi:hypothetical protein
MEHSHIRDAVTRCDARAKKHCAHVDSILTSSRRDLHTPTSQAKVVSMKKQRVARQLELDMPTWGGRREGAGRKRATVRPTVPHAKRPEVKARHPVFITIRVRADVPDLREDEPWKAIVCAHRRFRGNPDLSFVHYSVMRDHMHSVGEADGKRGLSRGMQAFSSRLAKDLNRCFQRKGPVYAGRYHARELKTPTETRNAIEYTLLNRRKHDAQAGIQHPPDWFDRRSTAAKFEGWRTPLEVPQRFKDYGTSPPRTWLLREGWRLVGSLDLAAIPGRTACPSTERPRPRRAEQRS